METLKYWDRYHRKEKEMGFSEFRGLFQNSKFYRAHIEGKLKAKEAMECFIYGSEGLQWSDVDHFGFQELLDEYQEAAKMAEQASVAGAGL